MRSVVVAILLAAGACHGAKQTGPAWPAPSTTEDDGGESIAPRDHTVAVVEKSADDVDDDEKVKPADAAKPAVATDDKPAPPAAQPTTPEVDEVIITDDIIIEIDDE